MVTVARVTSNVEQSAAHCGRSVRRRDAPFTALTSYSSVAAVAALVAGRVHREAACHTTFSYERQRSHLDNCPGCRSLLGASRDRLSPLESADNMPRPCNSPVGVAMSQFAAGRAPPPDDARPLIRNPSRDRCLWLRSPAFHTSSSVLRLVRCSIPRVPIPGPYPLYCGSQERSQ